jgi:transposase InsO family protein
MTRKRKCSTSELWARFRFSVVGPLLSSPPAHGELKAAIRSLADKHWKHPVSEDNVRFAASTIERWYYTAKQQEDPVGVLRRAVRKDCGKVSLAPALAEHLSDQYRDYKHWTYRLHYDNLVAWARDAPKLGTVPSYSTIRRYMQTHGMVRKRRGRPKGRPGEERAANRRETREIRSYEAEYVGSLWHLDFHHGSLKVLTHRGQWQRPIVLGILDDHSRLACHLQWYLSETAEDLVHGVSQAIQKRGLPRAIMSDNGPAMIADEVTEGLLRLGIVHEKTLPYSPYQNGKQESFWATLEGRLMEMLDGYPDLTLDFLNEVTQAWVEIEYNRTVHRETSCSPAERFGQAPDVLRPSPSSDALRGAFRLKAIRRQRTSDGTISLDGVRFEIPSRYRQFHEVHVRYARWDLSRVDVIDPRTGAILAPIYPLDRVANADGQRMLFDLDSANSPNDDQQQADNERPADELPPLLKKILADYSSTGMPPAYLPKKSEPDDSESKKSDPNQGDAS